ncbi:MAG: ribose-phosphate diphosphokinase [Proteobacteria bacterium]|nr:ribose-phosphate diphosphokinase [Pseudomonadota bacterium]MBU1710222.1 ribose-phosphate diphosphokinase [Pseudomonadota bacterium]
MKTTTPDNLVIISNRASADLARKVSESLDIPYTEVILKQFQDKEVYHAFPLKMAGRDVVIIGSTPDDTAHQEVIDLIDGSHYWRADSVNVIIPFLGYSTMERAKSGSGEIPKGITRTRQIFRSNPTFVGFIDLHSEAVLHAHSGKIRTKHLQTDKLIVDKIKTIGNKDIVLVSPDYGRSKWVAGLASMLGLPHTAADKDRFDTDQTMVRQVSSVVKGKTAIICDDMIRTGGSIIQTAERCLQAGALETMIMATHLVLCGDARKRIQEAGIGRIIGSDTYPNVKSDSLLDVYSVAPLIAEELIKLLGVKNL